MLAAALDAIPPKALEQNGAAGIIIYREFTPFAHLTFLCLAEGDEELTLATSGSRAGVCWNCFFLLSAPLRCEEKRVLVCAERKLTADEAKIVEARETLLRQALDALLSESSEGTKADKMKAVTGLYVTEVCCQQMISDVILMFVAVTHTGAGGCVSAARHGHMAAAV